MKIKKVKLLGINGNAYSASKYLYSAIKTPYNNGAILVLPQEHNVHNGFESINLSGTHYHNGFTFGQESAYKHCLTMYEAEDLFSKVDSSVAIIKDITNKEIYVIEKLK